MAWRNTKKKKTEEFEKNPSDHTCVFYCHHEFCPLPSRPSTASILEQSGFWNLCLRYLSLLGLLLWVAKLGATTSAIRTLSMSYSQNGLESESRSCMAVIDCCKALGVNHSLEEENLLKYSETWSIIASRTYFGKHRCRKGTQELKWASRFTQLGISCPQRIWTRIVICYYCWLRFYSFSFY